MDIDDILEEKKEDVIEDSGVQNDSTTSPPGPAVVEQKPVQSDDVELKEN